MSDNRAKKLTKAEKKIMSSIMMIGIVDENDNIIAGVSKQYVNLPKESKFVEGEIKHVGVLSQKLKCKVKFNKAGNHKFKVKLSLPETHNNVQYTSDEKSRNPNFEYKSVEREFVTDNNGEKIIEGDDSFLFVSPAGGDEFILKATDDNNKTVQSGKIQNKRKMHYVEVKMTGLTTCANSLNTFTSEYRKHSIIFEGLPEASMPYMENIGTDDSDTFLNNAQSSFNNSQGPEKNPYCIVIAYTDHLAVKDSNKIVSQSGVTVGGDSPINIDIEEANKHYALWNNIVTGEDWFVECYFLKDGGNVDVDKIVISKDNCTPKQSTGGTIGFFDSVDINTSGLSTEIGTITLKVNWVNRMRAGLSFPDTNIIAVCTRSWWRTKSTQAQNEVIVHEAGHQFNMVTDGSGVLPEKTANFYDSSQGHVGNHCHTGIPAGQTQYDSQQDWASSQCVMYGATNNHSDFCQDCTTSIIKMDLSNGV